MARIWCRPRRDLEAVEEQLDGEIDWREEPGVDALEDVRDDVRDDARDDGRDKIKDVEGVGDRGIGEWWREFEGVDEVQGRLPVQIVFQFVKRYYVQKKSKMYKDPLRPTPRKQN